MGCRLFFQAPRYVRGGAVDRVQPASRIGPRPDRHKTALYRVTWGRTLLWLRAQSHFRAPRDRPLSQPARTRLLPGSELRSRSLDAGRGHRKAPAGTLAGMAARPRSFRGLLAITFRAGI